MSVVVHVDEWDVWEALRDGELEDLLEGAGAEYEELQACAARIQIAYNQQHEIAKAIFEVRPAGEPRAVVAAYFEASAANTKVLFRMLDGKPVADALWEAVRPG